MKELIVHIGVHKTGSTAIQLFLHKNRRVLLNKYSINYPLMENYPFPFQHSAVAQMIKNDEHEKLDTFLLNSSKLSSKVLLSSESFSHTEKAPIQLKNALHIFDKISIIVYLRRQDLWFESVYQQFVKVGKIKSVSTFTEWIDTFRTNYEGLYSCDWLPLVSSWANIFGKENICVRPYEKSQFVNGTIEEDFLNSLQTPIEKKDLALDVNYPNRSHNKSVTDFLQMMNGNLDNLRLKKLIQILFTDPFVDSGEVYLSFDKRMEILKKYNNSNNEIARAYLNENKLFKDPLPDQENYPPIFKSVDTQILLQKIASIRNELDIVENKLKD